MHLTRLFLAFIALPLSVVAQSSLNVCKPPPYTQTSKADLEKRWNEDTRYQLSVSGTAAAKRLSVLGDVVRLNGRDFASLVRPVTNPRGDIASLTIDARRIEMNGTISLISGNVTFMAREIELGPESVLLFQKAPESNKDTIEFIADRLILDKDLRLPFQFLTSKTGRQVKLRVRELVIGDQVIPSSEAAASLESYGIDQLDFTAPNAAAAWDVAVGDKAATALSTAWRERVSWPIFFATKLTTFHALEPYNPTAKAIALSLAKDNASFVRQWQGGGAHATVKLLEARIRDNKDYLGWGPEFSPRQNITSQITELERFSDEITVAYLTNVRAAIVRGRETAFDAKVVAGLDQELLQLNTGVDQDWEQARRLTDELIAINAQKDVALQSLANRQQDVVAALEKAKRRARDAGQVRLIASAVAITASMFIASPQVGIAVAAGIGGAGELIANHQAPGDPLTVAGAVSIGLQTAKKTRELTDQLTGSWATLGRDRENLRRSKNGEVISEKQVVDGVEKEVVIEEKELRRRIVGSGTSVLEGVLAINDALPKRATTDHLTLSQFESEDIPLRLALEKVTAISEEELRIRKLHTVTTERLTTSLLEVAKKEEQRILLSASELLNDEHVQRWSSMASSLWADHFSSAYRRALALERSYLFQFDSLPFSRMEFNALPSSSLIYMDANIGALKDEGAGITTTAQLSQILQDQQDEFQRKSVAFLKAVREGRRTALNNRVAVTPRIWRLSYAKGRGSAAEQRFLEQINSWLAKVRTDSGSDNQPTGRSSHLLSIPITFPTPRGNGAEFLLGVTVTRLQFEGARPYPDFAGGSVTIDVQHPGFGWLLRDKRCTVIDFRVPAGDNIRNSPTTMPPFNPPTPREFRPADVRQDLELDQFYTYWPARAMYQAQFHLDGSPNIKNLKIERLDILIHYLQ